MHRARLVAWAGGLLCVLVLTAPVAACLWDSDTLPMERSRFPTALELITGKFLRHSAEFYEWRIKDREAKLQSDPSQIALYDDLAVAYNKVEQHQKAIEVILAKDKLQPGLYETYANLGAFYIYTGELEKSREAIAKAIEINPNAHFGREVYQKHLVEYVLAHRVGGKVELPLDNESRTIGHRGFAAHINYSVLRDQYNDEGVKRAREELQKALHGVMGMMRFADHRHPVLLESLGDLLLAGNEEGDAKQLAARAYLMASYCRQPYDRKSEKAYRLLAEQTLELHQGLKLDDVETQLLAELNEGNSWFDDVRAKEMTWIAANQDADAEFSRTYYTEPSQIGTSARMLALGVGTAVLILLIGVLLMAIFRRQAPSAPS